MPRSSLALGGASFLPGPETSDISIVGFFGIIAHEGQSESQSFVYLCVLCGSCFSTYQSQTFRPRDKPISSDQVS